MAPPCKSGKDCPEILKAKADMSDAFATALNNAVAPLLREITATGKDMVKYAERMRYGTERFKSMEDEIKDLKEGHGEFKVYIASAAGRAEAAAKCAAKSGRDTAIVIGVVTLVLTGIGLYLTYRGLAG